MDIQSLSVPEIISPLWARGGHLQTLLGHYLPSDKIQETPKKFIVPTYDGDTLAAEDYFRDSNVLVLLMHGLSGDSTADYMQITGKEFLENGIHVVLMNHRGAGDHWKQAKSFYHSGRSEDLSSMLSYLRKQYPDKKMVTVGFSMSGNIVALNASGVRSEVLPDLAVTVNAPLDLGVCSHTLQLGVNRFYDLRFVHRLRDLAMMKALHDGTELPNAIPRWVTVKKFDELYTAPVFGFKSSEDYYNSCSALNYIKDTEVPLWLITSEDDPFIPIDIYRELELPSLAKLSVVSSGGHLGYLHAGSEKRVERWLAHWARHFTSDLEKL